MDIFFQAITGPKLQFFDFVARWPGSVHDSRIFDNSRSRVLFETKRLPGVLLGDAGYACMTFLLTPLGNAGPPNSPEARCVYSDAVERKASLHTLFQVCTQVCNFNFQL